MTVKQRDTYVRKLRAMTMAEVMQGKRSTVVDITCSGPLSAPWEILQSPLDDVVLSNMWEKAAKIVTSPGAIRPAPFFPSKQTTENTFFFNTILTCNYNTNTAYNNNTTCYTDSAYNIT